MRFLLTIIIACAGAIFVTSCSGPTSPQLPGELQNGSAASLRTPVRSLTRETGVTYTIIYNFKSKRDGRNPNGDLVGLDGKLYGVTYMGGSNSGGTVYEIDRFGKERVIYSFGSGADGSDPVAGPTDVNNILYGTTENGGTGCSGGCGTVYSVTTGGVERVLYSFRGGSDGNGAYSSLIGVKDVLYGTTAYGGNSNCLYGCGTIFKINTTGNGYRVIHRFAGGTDGADPVAGLTELGGKLYGTTASGGSGNCRNGCGTVFEVTTSGTERVVYSFKGGRDGTNPNAGLIDVNGWLYGTTLRGGTTANCGFHRCGTIFKVNPSGTEHIIYRFKGGIADGANPQTPLFYLNGTFYGTTSFGGGCIEQGGCGTIFAVYAPGNEKLLHSFKTGADGTFPQAGLIDFNGWLYGTTGLGGSSPNCEGDCGTVYRLTP